MKFFLSLFILISMSMSQQLYAQNISLTLSTNDHLISGVVNGGTVLIIGHVNSLDKHCGYLIQLVGTELSNGSSVQELLTIKAPGENWVPVKNNPTAIKIYTNYPYASFQVVLKDQQTITPNDWDIKVKAESFTC